MGVRELLLERDEPLLALTTALSQVLETGNGQVALVSGEAGVGKSALVRALVDDLDGEPRALLGRCDALFTPRPLAPFHDVVQQIGGDLVPLLAGAVRPHEVADALLADLRREPSGLVLEDLHWADEATLDVLSLLCRRLDGVPVLLVATYRDDELHRSHPLRVVLGGLATAAFVTRLPLAPLSRAAVADLAGACAVDPDDLYRRTGGNPFFVTEVVASDTSSVPATVRDAVLARAGRLSEPARAVLDAVSIVPQGCDYALLEALAPRGTDQVDECLTAGALVAGNATVSFRHELARIAVSDALTPIRRRNLHRAALQALAVAADPDVARLAHHADAAGDDAAVRSYAPLAGAAAASLGAHREAAEHYARAIGASTDASADELGDLHERRAYECYLSGDFDAAVRAQTQALDHFRSAKDRRRQGKAARSLSLLTRYEGDLPRAWELGREAVEVLQDEPGHELAMAYCQLSHLAATTEDVVNTRLWARQATKVVADSGDVEAEVYVALNIATVQISAGDVAALRAVEEALQLALDNHIEEQAGRAYVALTWWAPRGRFYEQADRYLDAGLRYCEDRGLSLWHGYLLAYLARSCLDRGRLDEARATAELIVQSSRTSPLPRVAALSVLGLVAARRGDADPWPMLDEAWELARKAHELQRMEPAAVARAEALWLAGRDDDVDEATALVLELSYSFRSPWVVGEMLRLRRLAGLEVSAPSHLPEPFASEIAGVFAAAARAWQALDAPYEAALALARIGDEDDARAAVAELHRLGAQTAAARVAKSLRAKGLRGVSRGPRLPTRENPAGLTRREVEVLALVTSGLRNSEIADRLVVSTRTVEHHVAAALRKLDADTRAQAAEAAIELGIVPSEGR